MFFQKKRCIAMLLAGGQGSRLKVLTEKTAKPAVPFGGKYRIIDFPLSNCVNSGIDTVGILTQYQPLELNEYIGNGQPWGLKNADTDGPTPHATDVALGDAAGVIGQRFIAVVLDQKLTFDFLCHGADSY